MRLSVVFLGLFGLLSLASPAGQGQPAAFTGTWMAVADTPAGMQRAPSPVLGPRFGLSVTQTQATFRRTIRGQSHDLVLPLDGTTATYRFAARPCEGDQEFHEQARWEDGAIALSRIGSVPAGGGALRPASIRIRLRPGDGETLVVEGQMATRNDGPVTVGTVYRRSPTPMPDPPPAPPVTLAPATIAVLAWLPGTWSGLNGTTTFEERWTPVASGAMQGMGRTLRGDVQTGFEFFCVAESSGGLVYTAWPNARPEPTHFYATSATADAVTFENPAHDFPQVVKYTRLPDGTLQTLISATDGSRAQTFTLKKQ